jgi:hypothetical protein
MHIKPHNNKQTSYFTLRYAFFCAFYFCFTSILISQNTPNNFYVAANTTVFGAEHIHTKPVEKKQQQKKPIAIYLTEITLSFGLEKLTNTKLVYRTPTKKTCKKNPAKALLKTRKAQDNASFSNTELRFRQTDKSPYANTLGHGSNGFVSLVTGQQNNTKRKNKVAVSKFNAAACTLKTTLQSTKKQTYPTTNTVPSSVFWFLSIYSRPPPRVS